MDELELIVYNVGHGLAVSLIEYPEKYVTQIDLGSEGSFSPLKYLSERRRLRTDVLYITHPHADHLSDIRNAGNTSLRPDYIYYQDYDWNDVLRRERQESRWVIDEFHRLVKFTPRGEYSGKASLIPWRWTPENARTTFGESNYINNSSLFIIYSWRDFKISIAGDLETQAMERLVADGKFQGNAAGTDIMIVPHHGHTAGYTPKWPAIIGKPYISLISVQNRDPSVVPAYYSSEFAKGRTIGGRTRYSLTTRTDGTIVVKMWYKPDGKLAWSFTPE